MGDSFSKRSSAESDGYVVAAGIKAMGDECMDVLGYGHHACAGIAEVQLSLWLAIARVHRKPSAFSTAYQ
jgi:hypothetical protein